ncbi:MAG: hybrid sensor histidine kinase/response regulator [Thermodesulfobacteriota bacterium]
MKPVQIAFLSMLFVILFWIGLPHAAMAQQASKHVLLLNSYHNGYLWTDEITRGVQSALRGQGVDLHIDYMDTKRQFGPAYQQLLARILRVKQETHHYDAVVVSDDNAFNFVTRNRQKIFGATPIVFCGVNYLRPDRLAGIENVTGVNERANIRANLNLIKTLHPDCGKVVVITDNTITGQRIQDQVRQIRADRSDDAPELVLLYDVSIAELKTRLRHMEKDSVVLYTLFFRDKNNVFLEYDKGAELIFRHASVPVYGVWDFNFGFGMVGGYLTAGFDQGRQAGRMTMAVLNGADPEDIAVQYHVPAQLRFDFRQLERHGISLSLLPEDAVIDYKPVSFYEENRKMIWMALSVVGLLLMALCGVSYGLVRTRRAEKKVREFKKAVDGASDAIGMATPEGRHYYQNTAFDHLFGSIGDDPPATLFVDEKVGRNVFDTIKRGTEWSGEVAMHGRDNRVLDVFLRAYPVKRQEQILALVGVHTDLTERKQAEVELQKMDKLKGVGTLAGGIAHDFNNILTGLFGNMSMARALLAENHPAAKPLEEAEKSMDRATRLTKQLLTFSKGGDPVKADASLGLLVEETVRFDLSGSNVRPVFTIADDLWPAQVDRGQIQQVFSNLAINADQAMPDGGHLYISLENAEISEKEVQRIEPGRYVRVTIRDEGTGIAQRHLERIFEPYFSTKQTGNGLGLATVFSIINKHGGHISVSSAPGSGAAFTLYLPASDKAKLPERKPPGPQVPEMKQKARVLVMDDEEMIRKVAAEMLEISGYEVETATDGKQAVAMYKQSMASGKRFDVVIMDLTVRGGMGGVEALENLLEVDPRVTAVVSSGYAGDPVLAKYTEFGFKGIVPKPYSFKRLQEALQQILDCTT